MTSGKQLCMRCLSLAGDRNYFDVLVTVIDVGHHITIFLFARRADATLMSKSEAL